MIINIDIHTKFLFSSSSFCVLDNYYQIKIQRFKQTKKNHTSIFSLNSTIMIMIIYDKSLFFLEKKSHEINTLISDWICFRTFHSLVLCWENTLHCQSLSPDLFDNKFCFSFYPSFSRWTEYRRIIIKFVSIEIFQQQIPLCEWWPKKKQQQQQHSDADDDNNNDVDSKPSHTSSPPHPNPLYLIHK